MNKATQQTILIIGIVAIAIYLFLQMQKTAAATTAAGKSKLPAGKKTCTGISGLLNSLLGTNKKACTSGKGSGGGSGGGSGSGAATAGGKRTCTKTPGSAFCGCASCLKYAGQDSSGNEIYQKPDGSLVYADGSPATQADIACNTGACLGTVCNPVSCNVCVKTAQPCSTPAASAGGGSCFSSGACTCCAGCL